MPFTKFFTDIRMKDVPLVGGKTASLGEMYSTGLPVPNGFAVSAEAYRHFIKENELDGKIRGIIKNREKNIRGLKKAGSEIRSLIRNAKMPDRLEREIADSFGTLGAKYVAVRSSATAEDLPDASFAGQQESFLNVTRHDIIQKIKECFASLFTDRAISYREDKKFDHFKVFLSVAVQKQIFSKSSGVMFTIDPDNGHRNFIVINSSYGLGDYIVQGKVTPDEFRIFKKSGRLVEKRPGKKSIMETRSPFGVRKKKVSPTMQKEFSISDADAEKLASYAKKIEGHYKRPMDIEWSKGDDNILYIVQARPETVHSISTAMPVYTLKKSGKILAEGAAVGRKVASGKVRVIRSPRQMSTFRKGEVLVTKNTDPDWEPVMKMAAAIITEEGGRTSHCAIVAREIGVPAVIGVKDATRKLKGIVTVDCTHEKGRIFEGRLPFTTRTASAPAKNTRTKIYVNIADPSQAPDASLLPADGVGLAREEFIISSYIGEHPMKMIKSGKAADYVGELFFGISKIAASFHPRPVIIRFSDFKTNEYRNLPGGKEFEKEEENPMLGLRGASRYYNPRFEQAFRLECRALKKCIDSGLDNIKVMVPFCRTVDEAKKVKRIINEEGLRCQTGVMAEIPSNVILAREFAKHFDFFSIGSNDLTQLTLGVDRDNSELPFDERNSAVKELVARLIKDAHKSHRHVGICGEAPSNYPEFVKFLVKSGIDSISVNPDAVVQTRTIVSRAELQ